MTEPTTTQPFDQRLETLETLVTEMGTQIYGLQSSHRIHRQMLTDIPDTSGWMVLHDQITDLQKQVNDAHSRIKGLEAKVGNHGQEIANLRGGVGNAKEIYAKGKRVHDGMAKAVFPRLEELASHLEDLNARYCMLDAEVKHHSHELTPAVSGRTGWPVFAFVDSNPEADYITDTRDFDDADVPTTNTELQLAEVGVTLGDLLPCGCPRNGLRSGPCTTTTSDQPVADDAMDDKDGERFTADWWLGFQDAAEWSRELHEDDPRLLARPLDPSDADLRKTIWHALPAKWKHTKVAGALGDILTVIAAYQTGGGK